MSTSLGGQIYDDCEEPLTPSHLIVGRRLWSLPDDLTHSEDAEDPDFELSDEVLQRRAKYLNSVINYFWHRFEVLRYVSLSRNLVH